MIKIGFLGPEGTFTHDAALILKKDNDHNLKEYSSIQQLIYAVDDGEIDIGLVPIENALEGTVNLTVDILIHEVNLNIIGEVIIPIEHCLMAKEGIAIGDLTTILSHPQALAQCRRFLDSNVGDAKRVVTESTGAAASMVQESQFPWGAIANYRAADIYGLHVLKKGIQDHSGNSTRFIVLSKKEAGMTGNDKTTLAFSVDHQPGGLFQALKIFAHMGINLTKIESRPMRTLLGQYLFLVDLEGHKGEDRINQALDILYRQCEFFKILGSYPKYKDPFQDFIPS